MDNLVISFWLWSDYWTRKSLWLTGHVFLFFSTQEKGSKRTKRNHSKWNTFVRTNKSVWSQVKNMWERQLLPDSSIHNIICGIPSCSLALNKLHNPEPCYFCITILVIRGAVIQWSQYSDIWVIQRYSIKIPTVLRKWKPTLIQEPFMNFGLILVSMMRKKIFHSSIIYEIWTTLH